MFTRRKILRTTGSLFVGLGIFPTSLRASDAPSDFEAGASLFIKKLAGEALASLTETDIDIGERRIRFRKIMHRYFAFDAIAKWVLGRYWRRASEQQKEEYLTLFEKLMIVTYADRFEKYAGEKLHVEKTEIRGEKDALVHSLLERPDGQKAVAVIWRVRPKYESYKIVDVMVEGLSMGITQQKEFSSVIRQSNNNVEGLLSELRKRVNVDT